MVDRTGILPGSPLVLTLASIRFAPWPLISQKIDEIHDEVRDILPLLQNLQVQSISVVGQPASEITPAIWILMSGNRRISVHISREQMLLSTRDYSRFSEFSVVIDRILEALLSRMKFMHVVSLGVRYVDHITVGNDEKLEQYLDSSLLPPQFVGLERIGGITAASYKTENKELRVRCNTQPGSLALPDEIAPWLAMAVQPGRQMEIKQLGANEALLDMDAIEQFDDPFQMKDKGDILKRLNALHQIANAFFRREDVIRDHAFEAWKREKKA